jgi:hypothetical protein
MLACSSRSTTSSSLSRSSESVHLRLPKPSRAMSSSSQSSSEPSSSAISHSRKLKAQPSLECDCSISSKALYDGSLIYSSIVSVKPASKNSVPEARWASARRALLLLRGIRICTSRCWGAEMPIMKFVFLDQNLDYYVIIRIFFYCRFMISDPSFRPKMFICPQNIKNSGPGGLA